MRSSLKSCESVPAKLPSGFANKSFGTFDGCTLSTTTRPSDVPANAAAYFSATREFGEKSVGKRMFRKGYTCFGLWTLNLCSLKLNQADRSFKNINVLCSSCF